MTGSSHYIIFRCFWFVCFFLGQIGRSNFLKLPGRCVLLHGLSQLRPGEVRTPGLGGTAQRRAKEFWRIYYIDGWTDEWIVSSAVNIEVYKGTCQWASSCRLIFVNHLPAKYMSRHTWNSHSWIRFCMVFASIEASKLHCEAKLQRAYHELTNCEEGTWNRVPSLSCRVAADVVDIIFQTIINHEHRGRNWTLFTNIIALTNYLVRMSHWFIDLLI